MGHLKTINFPFATNEKLMDLGVPILKHFRVVSSGNFCLANYFSNNDTIFLRL